MMSSTNDGREALAMAEDVRNRIHTWDQGVWCLAAVVVAFGDRQARLSDAASQVLSALLLPTTRSELEAANGMSASLLAAQAAAPLLQVGSVLREGTSSWDAMPDEALIAQGQQSAQMVAAFKAGVLPRVPSLAAALEAESPQLLDVGTGVGSLALEFAIAFPNLTVTAIDVMPRVLALAEQRRVQHPAGDRVELVERSVADIEEQGRFDLAWLPAPFIPQEALEPGVLACARSLRPGGWLMMAHGKFGSTPVEDAINRFKTLCFGGTAIDDTEAEGLLRAAGLEEVNRVPTPPGAPGIMLGRAPGGP